MKNNFWTPTTLEYNRILHELEKSQISTVHDNGITYRKKRSSDVKEGQLSPFYDGYNSNPSGPYTPGSKVSQVDNFQPSNSFEKIDLELRSVMGANNIDLSFNVRTDIIEINNSTIGYLYQNNDVNRLSETQPLVIFIHGGGFIGGSPFNSQNFCKHLAQLSNVSVLNIDYRLSPEYSAEESLADCAAAVKWAFKQEKYNLDRDKIFVAGDSAGGSLATVMSYLSATGKLEHIAGQILMYPLLVMGQENVAKYSDGSSKEYYQEHTKIPDQQINDIIAMAGSFEPIEKTYAKNFSLDDPRVSPLMMTDNVMKNMPPTLFILPEFDLLRKQSLSYGSRLVANGVPAEIIEYAGFMHAFADMYGIFPQAEDVVREIVRWVSKTVTNHSAISMKIASLRSQSIDF